MILYHGSYTKVKSPDILHSRKNVDFGPGFYTTPLKDQAVRWCNKFIVKNKFAVISKYNFNEEAWRSLKTKKFGSYNQEWLDYIINCRSGNICSDFDIVSGGVANDKVFNTVELYFKHLIDKDEALKRLKYEKPNKQIAFKTENAIKDFLEFMGCEELC